MRRPPGRTGPLLSALAAALAAALALPTAGAVGSAAPAPDGDRLLEDAARVNDMSPAALRRLLAEDDTAALGSTGRVFFRDRRAARPDADTAPPKASLPQSQTFLLHSNPGALRTLYLDFDGATVQGTEWNEPDPAAATPGLKTSPLLGFSLDSDHATFNAEEHATIQSVWQRVAEDYAPFAIDVTTQAPAPGTIDRSGPGDQVYGTTALVTGDPEALEAVCPGNTCSGVAFLDVFDDTFDHARYQPALVFTAEMSDVFGITETISHEVGHNLSLGHDGNATEEYDAGNGLWAPIMGSGYAPITQWSNGDYPGASNKGDDLADVAASGAPLRADDAGGTPATAAALTTAARGHLDPHRRRRLPAGHLHRLDQRDREADRDESRPRHRAPAAAGLGCRPRHVEPAGRHGRRRDGLGDGRRTDLLGVRAGALRRRRRRGPRHALHRVQRLRQPGLLRPGRHRLRRRPDRPEPDPEPEVTAPDAPTIGKARPGRRGKPLTVKISWSAPADDGGAAVTAYEVSAHKVNKRGQVKQTRVGEEQPTTLKVQYMLPRGRWAFTVVAVNSAGRGAASAMSRAVRAR